MVVLKVKTVSNEQGTTKRSQDGDSYVVNDQQIARRLLYRVVKTYRCHVKAFVIPVLSLPPTTPELTSSGDSDQSRECSV